MVQVLCVCVECSLSPLNVNDCMRYLRYCKHSHLPQFNRSKRVLNRLPIYLGEDVCDNINKDIIVKEIERLGSLIKKRITPAF